MKTSRDICPRADHTESCRRPSGGSSVWKPCSSFSCSFSWSVPEREVRGDLRRFKALMEWFQCLPRAEHKKRYFDTIGYVRRLGDWNKLSPPGKVIEGSQNQSVGSGEGLTQIFNASTTSTSKDAQRPLVDEEKLSFCA